MVLDPTQYRQVMALFIDETAGFLGKQTMVPQKLTPSTLIYLHNLQFPIPLQSLPQPTTHVLSMNLTENRQFQMPLTLHSLGEK